MSEFWMSNPKSDAPAPITVIFLRCLLPDGTSPIVYPFLFGVGQPYTFGRSCMETGVATPLITGISADVAMRIKV